MSLRCAPGRAARAVGEQTTLANCAEPPSRHGSRANPAASTRARRRLGPPGAHPSRNRFHVKQLTEHVILSGAAAQPCPSRLTLAAPEGSILAFTFAVRSVASLVHAAPSWRAVPQPNARRCDRSFGRRQASELMTLTRSGGSHSDRETIDLATLPNQIKRAALLIYRLTR